MFGGTPANPHTPTPYKGPNPVTRSGTNIGNPPTSSLTTGQQTGLIEIACGATIILCCVAVSFECPLVTPEAMNIAQEVGGGLIDEGIGNLTGTG